MTAQSTINKLVEMRLTAMADAFRTQLRDNTLNNLSFEEKIELLVDIEYTSRKNNRLKRLIRNANFDQNYASIADLNYSAGRKLDKSQINRLATCEYIADKHNIIIMGAAGAGKSYLACAFGLEACKHYYTVKYVRLPELLTDLAVARGEGIYKKVLSQYRKINLLILDEWMLVSLLKQKPGIYLKSSMHGIRKHQPYFAPNSLLPDGTQRLEKQPLADAILDRIVHDSYTIEIHSDDYDRSMREVYGINKEHV